MKNKISQSHLIILHSEKSVTWGTIDPSGQLIESAINVPLETLPRLHRASYVLISGSQVLLTDANIPSKNQQKLIQAIPYALEEQLAEDIDDLHFALGKRTKENIAVAVIARREIEQYLQQLSTIGINPTAILPDILAVPKPDEGWGILYLNDTALVRTGIQAGFAIERDCLTAAIQTNLPEKLTIFMEAGQTISSDLYALGIPIIEKTDEQGVLAWLARGLIEEKPLNLLQGDYRCEKKTRKLLRPWLLTLALLTIWGGIEATKQWRYYQQLSQKRKLLNKQIETVYRETFPKANKIVNARVQMEQQLKKLRSQHKHSTQTVHFIPQLNKISKALTQSPSLNLKRIDYRKGRFEIQLKLLNLENLENLKQRIKNQGFTVEIISANSRNNLIDSRLRIIKTP